jgi:hypothetical protein
LRPAPSDAPLPIVLGSCRRVGVRGWAASSLPVFVVSPSRASGATRRLSALVSDSSAWVPRSAIPRLPPRQRPDLVPAPAPVTVPHQSSQPPRPECRPSRQKVCSVCRLHMREMPTQFGAPSALLRVSAVTDTGPSVWEYANPHNPHLPPPRSTSGAPLRRTVLLFFFLKKKIRPKTLTCVPPERARRPDSPSNVFSNPPAPTAAAAAAEVAF